MSDSDPASDPASKAWGGFHHYLIVKSHYGFATLKEMKHTLQHCCDKTLDDKTSLYLEYCFPNCTKSWWI